MSSTKHTILFLAANPSGTSARALDQEARSIRAELAASGRRCCFDLETRWATQPLDLLRELRALRPTVVHFSGRGSHGGLFFEGADGSPREVSTAALVETFGAAGGSVRLVVLSACYTAAQAGALLAHVDCVVGMSGALAPDAARAFAIGFHGGIGEGESVAAAYRQGCAAIHLEGLRDAERPRLEVRAGVDAEQVFVAGHDHAARRHEVSAEDLVRETHARLLAGYPIDAILRAGVLAQAVLARAVGKPSAAAPIRDLRWLDELRADVVRATGAPRGDLLEDAQRAADLVSRAAIAVGLLDEQAVRDARHSAERQASEPPPPALLRLDRAAQRRGLDDLLALSHRVLVLLVHGEVGQGHDHFDEVAAWRTRAVTKGPCQQLRVAWPAPSPSAETRLGDLLEAFASAAGAAFTPPPVAPAGPHEAAWIEALEATFAALDRAPRRLFVRHVLGWLVDGDVDLVARYLRMVWTPLAARRGEQLVCVLELRRAERTGFPLTRAWRTSRAEHKIARAIAAHLEEQAMPRGGHCAALPELTSARPDDLADWLRAERQLVKSAAMAEAEQLVTMTRGGRFDLVVERLASLNLDARSARR